MLAFPKLHPSDTLRTCVQRWLWEIATKVAEDSINGN
jgi:hypothetical protein